MRTLAIIAASLAATASAIAQGDLSIDIYYGDRPDVPKIAKLGPDKVESPKLAFRCAKVIPVEGDPIDDAIVLSQDGKIVAIGRAAETAIPDGFELVDAGDSWCLPGYIELHCHIAGRGFELNDTLHQTNPEMRTLDLITMDHEMLRNALAGGVTTVMLIPGSGSNMGGFGTLTKTWGRSPDEALVRFPGCLKIAQAGNPERYAGDLGMTHMGMNHGLRMTLERGQKYYQAWEDFDAGKGPKPQFDPALEYLRGLFRHEYPVCVHTQIYQVALQTLRELRDEFGLWTVIVHGTFDAYRLSEEAWKRGVPVSNGPRQFQFNYERGRFEGLAANWYSGGRHGFRHPVRGLGRDGIGINTDSPVIPQEQLQLQTAMAVRLGLPWEVGVRAITINAARFVGVQDRVGSLVVGKDADLVFWDGDPLDPRNAVEMTVVNGNIAYRRNAERPRF
ncbi:MAG: amidohydrolase family protein [Planctomycetes bacterium]|nr:amidohydrolase family protein [Planctomycetota bacterium]